VSLSSESNPVESFQKTIFVALLFALVFVPPLVAQKDAQTTSPKYDVQTETKMTGTVEEMKVPGQGVKDVVHMVAKTGTDTIEVYLCPESFLQDMGVNFSKGDQIAMTGSKVKLGDADLILAREVVKGSDTLVLRDGKGNPIWSWRH
jgi:hypothetical protein